LRFIRIKNGSATQQDVRDLESDNFRLLIGFGDFPGCCEKYSNNYDRHMIDIDIILVPC